MVTTLLAVTAYQAMFIYSGIKKIENFEKKCETLIKKIKERLNLDTSSVLAKNAMLAAILLEILGSVILIVYALKYSNNEKPPILTKMITRATMLSFIGFVILATYLYHPYHKQTIPFLSNVTTTAGFVLMYKTLLP